MEDEMKTILTDDELTQKIEDRVRWDIRVSNSDMFISTENGVVTLQGTFDKSYRHKAALKAIEETEGVDGIDDKSVVLEDYFRPDEKLKFLIESQILFLPLVAGEWIKVEVDQGVVKLKGCVNYPRFKAFAAKVTWELSGVKDCLNMIEIKSVSSLSNVQFVPKWERYVVS